MQLQPFRRPNIIDAETTRDAIVRHLAEIRELYAQRNRTLFASDAAGNSDDSDAHLRPADFIATIAEPPKPPSPKPGDLHDWDKLVDGCLYIDAGACDARPYLITANRKWLWVGDATDIDDAWSSRGAWGEGPLSAQCAAKATVIAVNMMAQRSFKDAITNDIIARNEARGVK